MSKLCVLQATNRSLALEVQGDFTLKLMILTLKLMDIMLHIMKLVLKMMYFV